MPHVFCAQMDEKLSKKMAGGDEGSPGPCIEVSGASKMDGLDAKPPQKVWRVGRPRPLPSLLHPTLRPS